MGNKYQVGEGSTPWYLGSPELDPVLHLQPPHQWAEAKDHFLCSTNPTTCCAAQNTIGMLCCKGTLLVYVWVLSFARPLERPGLAFACDLPLYSSEPGNSWNQEGTKTVRYHGTLHSMLAHLIRNIPAGKCIFRRWSSVVALLQPQNLPWHWAMHQKWC